MSIHGALISIQCVGLSIQCQYIQLPVCIFNLSIKCLYVFSVCLYVYSMSICSGCLYVYLVSICLFNVYYLMPIYLVYFDVDLWCRKVYSELLYVYSVFLYVYPGCVAKSNAGALYILLQDIANTQAFFGCVSFTRHYTAVICHCILTLVTVNGRFQICQL
jgi:hypothetical protein